MNSTQRHRVLVCYDVREPKRLRQTYRTMLGYGDPLQYSVFVSNTRCLCVISHGLSRW